MGKSLVPPAVEAYIDSHLVTQTEVEARLHAASMDHRRAGMCSSPEVGALLAFLVRLIGARQILEIGVFTGYSALKMASALPVGGRLVACDIEADFVAVGLPYWAEAGIAERIDLRIAPALDTLAGQEPGSFDMVFIDADKGSYPAYYEASLGLVRPGGLIVLDNMLWSGKVADPAVTDEETEILRALGQRIAQDARVDAAMLTVGDGVVLASTR